MKYDLDKFEQSAVIGYWRCGVDSATSAAIMDCTTFAVEKAIHDHKLKLNLVPQKVIKKRADYKTLILK